MRLISLLLAAALSAALGQFPAFAGQPCPEQEARNESMDRILRLSTLVRERLEQSGASVAYIARAGIDLREYGLVYSHLGLAWRDHPKGRWFTFHLMNPCNTDKSELADHSLEDFYKVELFTYDALVAVPSPEVQLRLLKAFFSPLAATLHHPVYNMISYPFSTRYQNSNQWVLEVSAAAFGPENLIQNRYQAQGWLKENGYEPTLAYISRLRRLGAQAVSPHIHFDDHTDEEHKYARYMVVTADSIIKLIERQDRGLKLHRLRLP
jgi:hypothetical protein